MTKTTTLNLFLLASFFAVIANGEPPIGSGKLSPCLEQCLEPMLNMEKSISFIYRNYEKVCDILENSAKCSQKCTQEDKTHFFQFTTFYRIHCVEFEEALEEHLECLKEASYKADVVCRGKCTQNKENKKLAKEEQQKNICKSVECSTICYYKEFARSCPCAKDVALHMNVRIADEMKRVLHPKTIETMQEQCRRIHDSGYMRQRMLENIKK
ncbi:chondroitin proteoglycan 4 domain-containing protein [Ditylenchus destructor]|uniref:Chondroitin proteoglycan 4 domain-containing protein n=1 Tax=Ditylenchus destructor TaxID=166010 RepID=A0AAD4NC34_9BILA|nr:chondroitin proteoglycan 4 domain-containing protein [Ditylenchus destructor]